MSEVELEVIDLKEVVLSNNSFGPSDVGSIRTAVSENYGHFGELRDAVNEMEADDLLSPAGKTKMGVCQFLLGKFSDEFDNAAIGRRQRDGFVLSSTLHVRAGQLQRSNWRLRKGPDIWLQRRPMQDRRLPKPIAMPAASKKRWQFWTTFSDRQNKLPTTCTSVLQRWLRLVAAWMKHWRCTNAPFKPTKTTLVPCSVLALENDRMGNDNESFLCTSVLPRRSHRHWRSDQSWLDLRGQQPVRQSTNVLQADSGLLSGPPANSAVHERCGRDRQHAL